jgi:hypothetical protein
MGVNESKADQKNATSWAKWKRSGAIGTMLDAETLPIRKEAKPVTAMGVAFNPDGTTRSTTLAIGEKVVGKSKGWVATKPEVSVVVPGEPFKLGQKVRAKDLPVGTQTVSEAYPKKA